MKKLWHIIAISLIFTMVSNIALAGKKPGESIDLKSYGLKSIEPQYSGEMNNVKVTDKGQFDAVSNLNTQKTKSVLDGYTLLNNGGVPIKEYSLDGFSQYSQEVAMKRAEYEKFKESMRGTTIDPSLGERQRKQAGYVVNKIFENLKLITNDDFDRSKFLNYKPNLRSTIGKLSWDSLSLLGKGLKDIKLKMLKNTDPNSTSATDYGKIIHDTIINYLKQANAYMNSYDLTKNGKVRQSAYSDEAFNLTDRKDITSDEVRKAISDAQTNLKKEYNDYLDNEHFKKEVTASMLQRLPESERNALIDNIRKNKGDVVANDLIKQMNETKPSSKASEFVEDAIDSARNVAKEGLKFGHNTFIDATYGAWGLIAPLVAPTFVNEFGNFQVGIENNAKKQEQKNFEYYGLNKDNIGQTKYYKNSDLKYANGETVSDNSKVIDAETLLISSTAPIILAEEALVAGVTDVSEYMVGKLGITREMYTDLLWGSKVLPQNAIDAIKRNPDLYRRCINMAFNNVGYTSPVDRPGDYSLDRAKKQHGDTMTLDKEFFSYEFNMYDNYDLNVGGLIFPNIFKPSLRGQKFYIPNDVMKDVIVGCGKRLDLPIKKEDLDFASYKDGKTDFSANTEDNFHGFVSSTFPVEDMNKGKEIKLPSTSVSADRFKYDSKTAKKGIVKVDGAIIWNGGVKPPAFDELPFSWASLFDLCKYLGNINTILPATTDLDGWTKLIKDLCQYDPELMKMLGENYDYSKLAKFIVNTLEANPDWKKMDSFSDPDFIKWLEQHPEFKDELKKKVNLKELNDFLNGVVVPKYIEEVTEQDLVTVKQFSTITVSEMGNGYATKMTGKDMYMAIITGEDGSTFTTSIAGNKTLSIPKPGTFKVEVYEMVNKVTKTQVSLDHIEEIKDQDGTIISQTVTKNINNVTSTTVKDEMNSKPSISFTITIDDFDSSIIGYGVTTIFGQQMYIKNGYKSTIYSIEKIPAVTGLSEGYRQE